MTLFSYILLKAGIFASNILELTSSHWVFTFLLSILAYFAPIYTLMLLLFLAVGVDTLSGLCKAWKLKEKITSWRLRDSVIKLFLYCLLIAVVYGIQISCLWGIPLVNFVAAFILFAETVSISENIDIISNNKLGLANFIKKLRKKWLNKVDEDSSRK